MQFPFFLFLHNAHWSHMDLIIFVRNGMPLYIIADLSYIQPKLATYKCKGVSGGQAMSHNSIHSKMTLTDDHIIYSRVFSFLNSTSEGNQSSNHLSLVTWNNFKGQPWWFLKRKGSICSWDSWSSEKGQYALDHWGNRQKVDQLILCLIKKILVGYWIEPIHLVQKAGG